MNITSLFILSVILLIILIIITNDAKDKSIYLGKLPKIFLLITFTAPFIIIWYLIKRNKIKNNMDNNTNSGSGRLCPYCNELNVENSEQCIKCARLMPKYQSNDIVQSIPKKCIIYEDSLSNDELKTIEKYKMQLSTQKYVELIESIEKKLT